MSSYPTSKSQCGPTECLGPADTEADFFFFYFWGKEGFFAHMVSISSTADFTTCRPHLGIYQLLQFGFIPAYLI